MGKWFVESSVPPSPAYYWYVFIFVKNLDCLLPGYYFAREFDKDLFTGSKDDFKFVMPGEEHFGELCYTKLDKNNA